MKTKIAVTYENGEVFQHFGHTKEFKFYTVEDKKIVDSEIVPTMGSGHSMLADFLLLNGVTVLICGGTGYKELLRLQDRFVYLPEMPYRKVDLDKTRRTVVSAAEFAGCGRRPTWPRSAGRRRPGYRATTSS